MIDLGQYDARKPVADPNSHHKVFADFATRSESFKKALALPPKRSIRGLIREAYKNRYGFERVRITKEGLVFGLGEHSVTSLDRVADHTTVRTASMNVQLRNRHGVVFTFQSDV